jgi:hypothetical protein
MGIIFNVGHLAPIYAGSSLVSWYRFGFCSNSLSTSGCGRNWITGLARSYFVGLDCYQYFIDERTSAENHTVIHRITMLSTENTELSTGPPIA